MIPEIFQQYQNHIVDTYIVTLRQTRTVITTKIIIYSNPATSILHHYRISDHDTYIFEELIFYIKLLVQTRQFNSTQETNQMVITKGNGVEN